MNKQFVRKLLEEMDSRIKEIVDDVILNWKRGYWKDYAQSPDEDPHKYMPEIIRRADIIIFGNPPEKRRRRK